MGALLKALEGGICNPRSWWRPHSQPERVAHRQEYARPQPRDHSHRSSSQVRQNCGRFACWIGNGKNNGGQYPETISCMLWGTDNIKTYGESLAQIMWMVGVNPLPDSLGRVNKVELIPLEELGRPRIDVVINCSGVFRDLFINQMNLLDKGREDGCGS